MKIAILGGCGFIGSNLCIYLNKRLKRANIISIDNISGNGSKFNLKRLKEKKIKNFKRNLSKQNVFKNIGKVSLFINCCSDPAVENSKKYINEVINNNFLSTLNMLNHSIKYNSNPEVSLDDGLIAVAVGEAAEKSIKLKRLVKLEEIID